MVRKSLQGIGASHRVSVKLSLVLGHDSTLSLRESIILMVCSVFQNISRVM